MSYLADIIKKQVRAKLQYEGEIQRANQEEPGTAVERIPAYEIEPVEVVDDIEEE